MKLSQRQKIEPEFVLYLFESFTEQEEDELTKCHKIIDLLSKHKSDEKYGEDDELICQFVINLLCQKIQSSMKSDVQKKSQPPSSQASISIEELKAVAQASHNGRMQ